MNDIGKPERATQDRVIALFQEEHGYQYLGDWSGRNGNSNIEEKLLMANLTRRGYSPAAISGAIFKLQTEANNKNRKLYGNNEAVYGLLRYGVKVKTAAGEATETVHLIDWKNGGNDFALAEEVKLKGGNDRRPDMVLYVNGLALGVFELKSSRASIGGGIRQLISNQKPEFNEWFVGTSAAVGAVGGVTGGVVGQVAAKGARLAKGMQAFTEANNAITQSARIVGQSTAGAVDGVIGQVAETAVRGESLTKDLGSAALIGAVAGMRKTLLGLFVGRTLNISQMVMEQAKGFRAHSILLLVKWRCVLAPKIAQMRSLKAG